MSAKRHAPGLMSDICQTAGIRWDPGAGSGNGVLITLSVIDWACLSPSHAGWVSPSHD